MRYLIILLSSCAALAVGGITAAGAATPSLGVDYSSAAAAQYGGSGNQGNNNSGAAGQNTAGSGQAPAGSGQAPAASGQAPASAANELPFTGLNLVTLLILACILFALAVFARVAQRTFRSHSG